MIPPETINCIRCNVPLVNIGEQDLMLKSYLLSGWFNPTLDVVMFVCPQCRHIEPFLSPKVPLEVQQ